MTLIDEPFDRIEYTEGNVPAGGEVTLHFVVSQPGDLKQAFIAQRPGRPVSERTREPAPWIVAAGPYATETKSQR